MKIFERYIENQLITDLNKNKVIIIYGTRRVGKTFLIREYFADKSIYLEASGAKDKPTKKYIGQGK